MTVRLRVRYVLGGNEGDVHSYDPATGFWYAVLLDPRECRLSNTGILCPALHAKTVSPIVDKVLISRVYMYVQLSKVFHQ